MLFKIFWIVRALAYMPFFGRIGLFSYLGKPIFLKNVRSIFIFRKVRIFPGARLEVHGTGRLEILDNVSIGNSIHIACAAHLIIDTGVLISSNVLITDIDHEYHDINIPVFDQPLKIRTTYIGKNCFIGAGAKILAGTYLCDGCIVGANAVVRGIYMQRCIIAASRAVMVKQL
jgi:acetyltransferase-like isoleucine patch superfamily enzyme